MELSISNCERNDERPIRTIGDKVSAKYKSFYNEKTDEIHHVWVGMVEIDGKMMGIYDANSFSGYVESPNRYQALKVARMTRDDGRKRLNS